MESMTVLTVPRPEHLERILGYPEDSTRVRFWWNSDLECLMWHDGLFAGKGHALPFLVWANHPAVMLTPLVRVRGYNLVLERERGEIYLMPNDQATTFVRSGWHTFERGPAYLNLLTYGTLAVEAWLQSQKRGRYAAP